MISSTKELVRRQFSESADLYQRSWIHSKGRSLKHIVELASPARGDLVLDIATGAGHTAIALAATPCRVVAMDLSLQMLRVAGGLAQERNLHNVRFVNGDAESLSFYSDSFDIITCRIAPHHFQRPDLFVKEVQRVLKARGRLVVVDTWIPEDSEIGQFINKIQLARDSTHQRSLPTAEWESMILDAGLTLTLTETWFIDGETNFAEWVGISRTPQSQIEVLQELFQSASGKVKRALQIRVAASTLFFQLPRIVLSAKKNAE